VKEVRVINDSTIEADLLIKTDMKEYIKDNARTFISTDGIMGNKLVNIEPSPSPGNPIREGDVLFSKKGADTDEMLAILSNTNNDLAIIASSLKSTISRINASKSVWAILEDTTLPENIKASFRRFRDAGENMSTMMKNLESASREISEGRGSIGRLIKDSSFALSLNEALVHIKNAGQEADSITRRTEELVKNIQEDLHQSKGVAGAVLGDSMMKNNFSATLNHLEAGTRAFNENMEALKHNFLFRGYFRKEERKKAKSKP
jgi:phospholipid/cholesterol/gamma-HCH transport system substrate-binding protein